MFLPFLITHILWYFVIPNNLDYIKVFCKDFVIIIEIQIPTCLCRTKKRIIQKANYRFDVKTFIIQVTFKFQYHFWMKYPFSFYESNCFLEESIFTSLGKNSWTKKKLKTEKETKEKWFNGNGNGNAENIEKEKSRGSL